jgi:hypothetical protein
MEVPAHRRRERLPVAGGVTQTTEAPAPAATPVAVKPPETRSVRLAAIREARGRLDPENPGHFTVDGKPHIQALEAHLRWRPSAEERDEAMEGLGEEREN